MPNRRDSSRARVMASIDKSLQRLRTDHVDVYLVHWPDPATPLDETMRALDDIVRQGKVRYIGVSNFRLAQIEECMRLRRIDVVQYAWNMFDRRMQAEIFPYCARSRYRRDGVRLARLRHAERHVPRRHAVRGERLALAGRQCSAASTCSARCSGPSISRAISRQSRSSKRLAAKYGKTLPQFALRWTLSNPVVSARRWSGSARRPR